MKSERLKGIPQSAPRNYDFYTSVQTLPRVRNCSDFMSYSSAGSDDGNEEYYPFVIGRGKNFKIIDPKLFKQLRKHNIHQKVPVWVSDCAKKTSLDKTVGDSRGLSPPLTIDSEDDQYCELSPLARSPPPLPPRKQVKTPLLKYDKNLCSDFKKPPTLEKRLQETQTAPKPWKVEVNPKYITSLPTTKLVSGVAEEKSKWADEECETRASGKVCGFDSEEVVDYATCMCCVKGLFYHCTKDSEDEGSMADEPCSCTGPACVPRWGCLGVLALLMPCIWCYLPVAGCRKACSSCKYKKTRKQKRKEKLTS
ncbi:protein sprouty homolog 4 [Nematostella vectensis]|nr:protein sprouty homolog 4 [Nematostella vectensis]